MKTAFAGHLSLRAATNAQGRTVLAHQSFRAPFHLSKPYWDGHALLVQVVNPTAGVLEGDRLTSDIAVDGGASLLVTTPSATRVFTMADGEGVSEQRFSVARGGWLEFIPEPLVPHCGSRYRQQTEVSVEPDGELIFADVLMPGRIARGESWSWARLSLELTVRVGGELILHERFSQSGPELRALAELAGMAESASFANLVLVSPRLDEDRTWHAAVRALHGSGSWLGLSPLRGNCGGWSVKVIAADGIHLRHTLKELRCVLAPVLPRLATETRKL